MHVLLIKPDIPKDYPIGCSEPQIPLGLASIAGVLKQNGMKVSIIDNYLDRKNTTELIFEIQKLEPDLLGITCDIASIKSVAHLVGEIRKSLEIPVVVGGPEVSVHPKETFLRIKPDVCVYGEGELTMLELCNSMVSFNSYENELERIEGIIYFKNGNIKINPPRPLIQNLDEIPFMPLDLFPINKYKRTYGRLNLKPVDCICTSRGCPFRCSFCSNEFVWGHKVRAMSPKRVVDEIAYMIDSFGSRGISFREDNFTVLKNRVMGICKEIRNRKLDIEWICESRVDLLTEELLQEMSKSGCKSIWFGVESGSQRVLDLLNKDITIEQTKKAFRLCKKYGIKSGASTMLGIPGETKEEMIRTVKFVESLDPDYVFWHSFIGIPGSEIYKVIEEKDLVYDRYEGLILPNTEEMTWPEKVRFAEKAFIDFNMQWKRLPKLILREIRYKGVRIFVKEVMKYSKSFVKTRYQ